MGGEREIGACFQGSQGRVVREQRYGGGRGQSPGGVSTGRGEPECPPMEMLTHGQSCPSPKLVTQAPDGR